MKKITVILCAGMLLCAVLSGCRTAQTAVQSTVAPTQTPQPTVSAEPLPTDTPVPAPMLNPMQSVLEAVLQAMFETHVAYPAQQEEQVMLARAYLCTMTGRQAKQEQQTDAAVLTVQEAEQMLDAAFGQDVLLQDIADDDAVSPDGAGAVSVQISADAAVQITGLQETDRFADAVTRYELEYSITLGEKQYSGAGYVCFDLSDANPWGLRVTEFALEDENYLETDTETLVQCDACGGWFAAGQEYDTHTCSPGADAPQRIQCPDCEGWFMEGNEFRNHVCQSQAGEPEEQLLQCSVCGGWFAAGQEYENHTCSGNAGMVECDRCGVWFATGNEFRNHICAGNANS